MAKSGLSYAQASQATGIDVATLKKWRFRTGEPWLRTAEAMACAARALDANRAVRESSPVDARTITLPEAEWKKLDRLRGRMDPGTYVAMMIRHQMETGREAVEIRPTVWQIQGSALETRGGEGDY